MFCHSSNYMRRSNTNVLSKICYPSKFLKPSQNSELSLLLDTESKRHFQCKSNDSSAKEPLFAWNKQHLSTNERKDAKQERKNFVSSAFCKNNNGDTNASSMELTLPNIHLTNILESKKIPISDRHIDRSRGRYEASKSLLYNMATPKEEMKEKSASRCKTEGYASEPKLSRPNEGMKEAIKAMRENMVPVRINNEATLHATVTKDLHLALYKEDKYVYPLRASLFPNVPPYLNFATTEKLGKLPREIRNTLHWKVSNITSSFMKKMVRRTGFNIIKEEEPWTATWGRHISYQQFREFNENQKINHFPGTFHLGRKDRLWLNIVKMQELNGKENFSFMPETFILPQNMKELRVAWLEQEHRTRWILKPPASARGIGIGVVHRWTEIPKDEPVLVQRYISSPYLINNTKFDLRLYVLVTSFNPLRVYVFKDGLVRFATEEYSRSFKHLRESYIHLTNYSINRSNSSYVTNEDENVPQGHKWSLKCLWTYFRDHGIDDKKIWSSLIDVVVKTIISCEGPISRMVRAYTKSRYSCYELFGFDIMLDDSLKPWLLEVNISPSLHTSSQLDLKIKGELIKDTFNTVGFHLPAGIHLTSEVKCHILKRIGTHSKNYICFNKNLYQFSITQKEKQRQAEFRQNKCQSPLLNDLTADDIKQLVQSEDELVRCGRFVRVFPSDISSSYLKYFEVPKYYNFLLDAWERKYKDRRMVGIQLLKYLCSKEVHLKSASSDEPIESNCIRLLRKPNPLNGEQQTASPTTS